MVVEWETDIYQSGGEFSEFALLFASFLALLRMYPSCRVRWALYDLHDVRVRLLARLSHSAMPMFVQQGFLRRD